MSEQAEDRAALDRIPKGILPPCPKTQEEDGGHSLAWYDPEDGICGWCGACEEAEARRCSVTATIPLDTPEARQNAAVAFGYPDWQSLLDAAQAGAS
jgi:hypothetical protein